MSKKIIALILIISTAIFGALYMYRNIFSFKDDNNIVALTKGKLISDVYTDKARYYPSDKVTVKIELNIT